MNLKDLYTGLLSGAVLFMMVYMLKALQAKSTTEREKFLDDERAFATVADAMIPLV